jgi:hypothetical protein
MDGLFLVVRCTLDLSYPLPQGQRTTNRRAGGARATASTTRFGAWTGLDQIGVLTRLVHRQRQAEASAETWSFDGQRVIQEWRTSASITFGEFLKALGNHTTAMLQWRPQFLKFFASGPNPATLSAGWPSHSTHPPKKHLTFPYFSFSLNTIPIWRFWLQNSELFCQQLFRS